MKTLIVDDIEKERKQLHHCLKKRGCTVIEAADGKEGLERARAESPDLIISDGLMPRMDGFQFLRAVRKDPALKTVPFIFYSAAYVGPAEEELALSLGADAFIAKPKKPAQFWKELISVLENSNLKKGIRAKKINGKQEEEYLRQYSNIVAAKLEEKVRESEITVESLRESEHKYRVLFEENPLMIFTVEPDGTILSMNRTGMVQLGYSVEDVTGKSILSIFHPDDREEVLRQIKECLIDPAQIGYWELRKLRKDGSVVWVRETARPVTKNDGCKMLLIVCEDITERKATESALTEAYAELDQIFNSAADGMRLIDRNYNQLRVNRTFLDLVGMTAEEAREKKCFEMFICERRKTDACSLTRFRQEGIRATEDVIQICRKDGTVRYCILTVMPFHDQHGELVGFIEDFRDITEHRKLEEQLRQAQKMEALGLLAGGIAHDFNNILGAIVGYGGLLHLKMDESDPLRSYAEQILSLSERAASLVQGLLAFGRKQTINPKPADINQIVRTVEKILSRIIGEKIEVATALDTQAVSATVDSAQIEQVLMNLATNARDAMPEGGKLTVSTEAAALDDNFVRTHGYGKPGRYVLISVTDTGTGMDHETMERIFDPFFTTKELGRGTGLGLAIVYGIVKQHEGYITVYSEPGMGTTFRIYLPASEKEEAEGAPVRPSQFAGGSETILFAEDTEYLRRGLKHLLETFGYTIIEAADGEEAIRKFIEGKERIQLVITDIGMPKKNGREVYEEIRKISPDCKIIFTSGYDEEIMISQGIVLAGLPFINKPVSPRDLLKKIREVLDTRPA